jgi:hypothetical protein
MDISKQRFDDTVVIENEASMAQTFSIFAAVETLPETIGKVEVWT